ncbi:MAG TPA: SseB family protein [Capsulimonadaceae bacterium]
MIEPNKPAPFLVVPADRFGAIKIIVLFAAFAVLSVASHFGQVDEYAGWISRLQHDYGWIVGGVLFTAFAMLGVRQAINNEPVLVFDTDGISVSRIGVIPWKHIAAVTLQKDNGLSVIAIIPRDLEALAASRSEKVAKRMRSCFKYYGCACRVGEGQFSGKAKTIFDKVANFAAEQIALAAPLTNDTDTDHEWFDGTDRHLYDPELEAALNAVVEDDNRENREAVYRILLRTSFSLKDTGSGSGTSVAMLVEDGHRLIVACSDPNALRKWDKSATDILVAPPKLFFDLVLSSDADGVVLNPAGPVGGRITRREIEYLSRGEIPPTE